MARGDSQDYIDGCALRRWLDAPAWGADTYRLTLDVQSGEWEAVVTGYTVAFGRGSTIAEAADACREALPVTSIGGHRDG